MKYYEVNFSVLAPEELFQDACDIASALAGEAGFETFEETAEGLKGYVQQSMFDQQLLEQLLADFPLPDCAVTFTVKEAEDKDWNEQWEQEGFEPIVVSGERLAVSGERLAVSGESLAVSGETTVVIYDGRHLPADLQSPTSNPSPLTSNCSPLTSHPSYIPIEIDARMAFGTGTHETTRMIVSTLLGMDLAGKTVLDCGTGTGILSIVALKCGGAKAVGYDIDEWSADNARHNAVINRVDERFTSLLGDATLLDSLDECFDVVLANINRNILLADMSRFVQVMNPGAVLILSGFYQSDIPLLLEKASSLNMKLAAEKHDGDWACLILQNLSFS